MQFPHGLVGEEEHKIMARRYKKVKNAKKRSAKGSMKKWRRNTTSLMNRYYAFRNRIIYIRSGGRTKL